MPQLAKVRCVYLDACARDLSDRLHPSLNVQRLMSCLVRIALLLSSLLFFLQIWQAKSLICVHCLNSVSLEVQMAMVSNFHEF